MFGKRIGFIGCRVGRAHAAACAILLSFCMAAPASAVEEACCNLATGVCFDDDPAIADKVCTDTLLGPNTTCYDDCDCPAIGSCPVCMTKQSGNFGSFEFQLVGGSGVFDGTNTTFTYRVCQLVTPGISHFVLNLGECCDDLVPNSTTGGDSTGSCGLDGSTGFTGLKFDITTVVPACIGTCGTVGNVYSFTLSGNVPTAGCLKILNKADAAEDTSTGCIKGPDCSVCVSSCGDDVCECDENSGNCCADCAS